jgi:hypothetical protein
MAEPDVGEINVLRVRTVVVFPAPLGPRNPKTSPLRTLNVTSLNAVRSPKRLVRPTTWIAVSPVNPELPVAGGTTEANLERISDALREFAEG